MSAVLHKQKSKPCVLASSLWNRLSDRSR